MIIWFTGQPNSGKTTLAKELMLSLSAQPATFKVCKDGCDCKQELIQVPELKYIKHIDGDELRKLNNNVDYSMDGRRLNVAKAFQMAVELRHKYDYIIVSMVSPFKDQRDWFKLSEKVVEIYLKSNRERSGKMVDYYEPPTHDYLFIDTDKNDIKRSVQLILDYIYKNEQA